MEDHNILWRRKSEGPLDKRFKIVCVGTGRRGVAASTMFFAHSRAIRELREQVAELKSAFSRLEMDWDEVLARLKRRTAAAARATQRLEEVEKEQASTEDGQEGEASDMSRRSHVLSPRARAINDAILARRKGVQ